jgi:hypothetical protein
MHNLSKSEQNTEEDARKALPVAGFTQAKKAEDAEVQALVALADTAARTRIRLLRVHIAVALLIGLTALPPIRQLIPQDYRDLTGILSAATAVALLLVTVRHRRATERASAARDPRVIGALLDALDLRKQRGDQWINISLIELLPRLDTEIYAGLSDSRRATLCKLVHGKDSLLGRAALEAVCRFGGALELPHVAQVAEGRKQGGKHREWSRLAQEALPAVRERAERTRLSGSLLRPAAAEPADESLLRPVGHTTEVSEQLLRGADSPEVNG